jgi:DNA-binding NarL/FixJ family response regulator
MGLDNTILNTALPRLAWDLHATDGPRQWIVDSYMLVFAGLLLAAGSLGERSARCSAVGGAVPRFARSSAPLWPSSSGSARVRGRSEHAPGCALRARRARKRDASPLDQLTTQELQITGLVADAGLSNPEIAARLFRPRKTVEYHLTGSTPSSASPRPPSRHAAHSRTSDTR